MLKIGSVRWKGRCTKHSGYDPETDGRGAIRGGCRRCEMLYDIWEHHQKMVRLIREFGHREEDRARAKAAAADDRQLSLLGGGDEG